MRDGAAMQPQLTDLPARAAGTLPHPAAHQTEVQKTQPMIACNMEGRL